MRLPKNACAMLKLWLIVCASAFLSSCALSPGADVKNGRVVNAKKVFVNCIDYDTYYRSNKKLVRCIDFKQYCVGRKCQAAEENCINNQ